MLTDFHICISVPLVATNVSTTGSNHESPGSFPGRAELFLACPLQNYVG